ncbi:unnamed protein product, partial [Staurois parvus]
MGRTPQAGLRRPCLGPVTSQRFMNIFLRTHEATDRPALTPSSPDTSPPPPFPVQTLFTPFQSGHFHPPSSLDTFHPLPVRTLSPPSSPDTFTPFQSGHFHPLPVR